jgi:serine-type D-Ala-D-Ala carboxypeptidase (penicillin-binding protein 5/6)
MKRIVFLLLICVMGTPSAWAVREKVNNIALDPYISALVIDADSGQVLFEDHAETVVYPASVLKLMDLLIVLEHIEQGKIKLEDMVQVTKEAARMGGSQVYLDPKEQFSVQDLLYALAIQSANDAAVALAIHVAGSTEGFIGLMNKRAQELGMKDSHFYSVHGLPPSKGQKPDETTARDLALLSRELAKRPEIFEYTGTKERALREGTFIMRNHNHLLGQVSGCDGFKTGYFQAAGFSIVATAKRDGVRIIAIVMGSQDRKVRDAKAAELLAKGFASVPPRSEVATASSSPGPVPKTIEKAVVPQPETILPQGKQKEATLSAGSGWKMFFWGIGVGLAISGVLVVYISRRRSRGHSKIRYR